MHGFERILQKQTKDVLQINKTSNSPNKALGLNDF